MALIMRLILFIAWLTQCVICKWLMDCLATSSTEQNPSGRITAK
jgi:hypothetical protein